MTTWISLLRGINVSGKNSIKMADLKLSYGKLGFRDVKNYLQSGNIIFNSGENDPVPLGNMISVRLKEEFGLDVPVIVLSINTLQRILENNPFRDDLLKDKARQYITYLFSTPGEYDITGINAAVLAGEEISISNRAAYLYCPGGYGRTKLSNTFIEKKLKVPATTRNIKTSEALLRMSVIS
ncbi:MAG TPA: DUF1697 domain-containing protein [Bacteroidales bacterium]|nr:DUF1697 domain-containing protein [Bacteroidales bacterium]